MVQPLSGDQNRCATVEYPSDAPAVQHRECWRAGHLTHGAGAGIERNPDGPPDHVLLRAIETLPKHCGA